MADRDVVGFCTVCNKADARLCGRCKSSRYCSTTCQRADWRTHKLLCAAFSSFDVSSRPTEEHFRAILFPIDNKKPEILWLKGEWRPGDSWYQYPEAEAFLGPNASPSRTPIQYNPVLKRQLSDTIYVCHNDNFLIDGSKANDCIAAITATKPGQYYDWRAPIVAYGKEGLGVNQTYCRDLDMNDFRHITDYFLTYGYKPLPATPQPMNVKIKGVKINCIGDQKMFKKPHFEAVEISSTDPIFSEHDTSDIADRVGIPIFTRRCPPDPKWANDQGIKFAFENQDATFLHLCCDPKVKCNERTGSLGWGWASKQWQNRVGSVIVVRQDKKPLSPLHVEALCKYCFDEVLPLLEHSMGAYSPEKPLGKDAVLAMICRPTFVIFWHKLWEEKSDKGEEMDAPYPYDD